MTKSTSSARAHTGRRSETGRRLGKWTVFTVGFTLVPSGMDATLQYFARKPVTLQYFLSAPTSYAVGVGIISAGLGELIFDYRRKPGTRGASRPVEISLYVLTVLLIFAGGVLYSAARQYPNQTNYIVPAMYVIFSVIVSAVSVYAVGRSA